MGASSFAAGSLSQSKRKAHLEAKERLKKQQDDKLIRGEGSDDDESFMPARESSMGLM